MTADRARRALAVLQDADGKFICEVPCGYIVEQTASAHKPRRIQAQRRRRAMLRRRVALTVALLTVAALLAALMPWSGSGAADKPKDTTAGTLEEVHQPTAVLLPSSGTVAGYVPNTAEVEALAKLIYGEAGIVPSTTEQAAVVWCVLNRVDDPRFPDTVLEVIEAPYQFSGYDPEYPVKEEFALLAADVLTRYRAERDGERTFPEIVALIHSEVSEALEEYRDGKPLLYFPCNAGGVCCEEDGSAHCGSRPYDLENPNARCSAQSKKPEGIAAELADVIIRVLDYCAYAGIDIENVLEVKHEYNKSRPYRHGGKKC